MKQLLLALLLVSFPAHAEYIDLSQGGKEISPWMRCDEEQPQVCVIVQKDDKQYLVVHDRKGELRIYEIVGKILVVIWDRETI